MVKKLPPLHPGEVLREEFLKPLGLSAGAVARACGVPRTRIERIAREELGITGDTAVRLARYFDTTPDFWLNLQKRYEAETASRALGNKLSAIVPYRATEVVRA
jgi:addiction module HigA family antidote